MNLVRLRLLGNLIPLFVLAAGCGDGQGMGSCEGLTATLAGAEPGDVIVVGTCKAEGSFVVPDGVSLRGTGAETSTILGTIGPAVTLGNGSGLEGLRVVAGTGGGVLATSGSAEINLEDVIIEASLEYGLWVEGASLNMQDVTVLGPVTAETATTVPPMPTGDVAATHGVYLRGVGTAASPARLEDVSVHGFARFGALIVDSFIQWTGGAASENLAVGLMIDGGEGRLQSLEICGTLQGIQPLVYGAVLAGGASITTDRLALCDNEGYGMLHDNVDASHANLNGSGNSEPALWVQRTNAFDLGGADTRISGNKLAGIVLVDTPSASIQDATIEDTQSATRISGELGEIRVGDGIHGLFADTENLKISNLTLTSNARLGLLLDVDAGIVDSAALSNISVDGSGEQLGVIAQGPAGLIPSGEWDATIARAGAPELNDPRRAERLSTLPTGVVAPMFRPPAE